MPLPTISWGSFHRLEDQAQAHAGDDGAERCKAPDGTDRDRRRLSRRGAQRRQAGPRFAWQDADRGGGRNHTRGRPEAPTRPSPAAWGWAYRSAVQSSKLIKDDCGRPRTCPGAPSFNSRYLRTQTVHLDFEAARQEDQAGARECRIWGHGRRFGKTHACFSTASVSRPSAAGTTRHLSAKSCRSLGCERTAGIDLSRSLSFAFGTALPALHR
jgi:hypothetical protein